MFKRENEMAGRCKLCYLKIPVENYHIGVCRDCAEKEAENIRKRIMISGVIGIILIVMMFFISNYAASNAYENIEQWDKRIYIHIAGGLYIPFHETTYAAIAFPSIYRQVITILVCFFAPFSSFVEFPSKRLAPGGVTYFYFGVALKRGAGDIIDTIISLMLMLVSGPFFFVYRLYKLRQINKYINTFERVGI